MRRALLILTVVAVMAMTVALPASAAFADHVAQGGGSTFGQCTKTDATDPTVIILCISPSHRGGGG